jgi:hypothetical protein
MLTNYSAMLFRFFRALKALMMGSLLATNPVKGLTVIILGVMIPYLIYAFLGGAVFVLILFGSGFLIWWMATKKAKV